MTAVLWGATPEIQLWDQWDTWQRGYRLLGVCLGGLLAYVTGLWILGLRPAMLRR
jgi:hypothetical protein